MPLRPQLKEIRWLGDSRKLRTVSRRMYVSIHVATFSEAVYVLHAFQKKAKTGIGTPYEELDVARRSYRGLVRERTLS